MGLLSAILEAYTYNDYCVGSGHNYSGVSTGYLNHPYHSSGYDRGPLCEKVNEQESPLKTSYASHKNAGISYLEYAKRFKHARINYRKDSIKYILSLGCDQEYKEEMFFWKGQMLFWKDLIQFEK